MGPGLLLLIILPLIKSTFGSHDGIPDTNTDTLNKIKQWANIIQTDFGSTKCNYPINEIIEQDSIFIQTVICGHPNAISDYSWDGKLNAKGAFDGRGTIRLGMNQVKTGRQCIRLGKNYKDMFGGEMKEFSAAFANGVLVETETILAPISKGGKALYTIEAKTKKGALHGVYRIQEEKTGKWGLGRIDGGSLNLAHCWVFNRDLIYYGTCEDLLTPHSTNEGFVIYDNFSKVTRGILSSDQTTLYEALFTRIQLQIDDVNNCFHNLIGDKIYPYFEFSVLSRKKSYGKQVDISDDEKMLCSKIDDRVIGSSINNYFKALLDNFKQFFYTKPHPSTLNKKAVKLINRIDHVEGSIYEAVFTFTRKTFSEFKYTGDLDEDGNFHGFGILELSTKNQCMRGKCSVPEINLISGFFENGVLEGSVYIVSEENIQGTAAVAVKGVLHGHVLTKGMINHYPYPEVRDNPNFNTAFVEMQGLGFYGYFLNGKPSGTVWYGMVGFDFPTQGLLYGRVDSAGKLSGSDISYIYPNHYNVLHGSFEDKYMKAATYGHIEELNCNEDGILEIKVSKKHSGVDHEQVYFYDPPSNISLGSPSMLTVEDPYEAEVIFLAKSSIPNSGSGIFARRPFKKHDVVAWYSGQIYGDEEMKILDDACRFNSTLSKESVEYCYKYRISTFHGALLDIPEEYDSEAKYGATLGHKYNNGFGEEVNSAFHQAEHPRFGGIVYMLATKSIKANEELLVNYGYRKGHHIVDKVFNWYFKAEDQYNKKMENKKKLAYN